MQRIKSNFNWSLDSCPYTLGWKDIECNGAVTRLFAIVCTGTHNKTEWVSNVTVIETGCYHAGFNSGAKKVLSGFKDYLNAKIGDKNISDCKLLVTGHSRGAAVANILAGAYLTQLGFKEKNIYAYTYACPNVYRGKLSNKKISIITISSETWSHVSHLKSGDLPDTVVQLSMPMVTIYMEFML